MSRAPKDIDGAGGVLTVDLAALADNYQTLKTMAKGTVCAAVVKADAYGLGLEPVSQALSQAGCETFFVALANEALELRAHVPEAVIYVLDGLALSAEQILIEAQAQPVLGSLSEIQEWLAICKSQGSPLPAALHIDTGMNRLGLPMEDLTSLKTTPALLEGLNISLIMTHLACADEPDHEMNQAQLAKFKAASRLLPRAPLSVANSAGVLNGSDFHFDLVRPGIALYGGYARPQHPNQMKPVVRLETRILQTRTLHAGETIGYGAVFTAQTPMTIAVLSLGYADGVFRSLGGANSQVRGEAYIAGHKVPIVGRISMDLITVDVTGLLEADIARGAAVEMLGAHITIDDVAQKAQTIGYEVLTSLSQRTHWVYTS